ncbi:astacin-like metalloendopeptidase [Antedon mediterranea]|uniref:astacin-like metalloendopeptidase n=1 Tax=Antedon mediterranea TaxID=105859 RepID=UPI003AF4C504
MAERVLSLLKQSLDKHSQTTWSGEYFLCPSQSENIASKNYPDQYDNDLDYTWTFHTNPENVLLLKFYAFDIETAYDYVSVDDGSTTVKYEGSVLPQDTWSSSNTLVINFITDASGTYGGFLAGIEVYKGRLKQTYC